MNIFEESIKMLCSSLDLDNEQRFYFLSKFLDENDPDRKIIKEELHQIINDNNFDLHKFVLQHDELIENVDLYTRIELVSYLKMWLWEYLYPEAKLTDEEIDQLQKKVTAILKDHFEDDVWVFSYDLYDALKNNEQYQNFEYYNLWKLNFHNSDIERKPIKEKYQEIGYLRYKGN